MLLQWGRRLSTSETVARKRSGSTRCCFNGADVFQRRRQPGFRAKSRPKQTSFNGADVFQRRRPHEDTPTHTQKAASMGPTSFNVGDHTLSGSRTAPVSGFNGADVFQRRRPQPLNLAVCLSIRLQWGRRLSTSETTQLTADAEGRKTLQWGRRLSTSETEANVAIIEWVRSLQWGRRLSTSETHWVMNHHSRGLTASMGPTSFNVGDAQSMLRREK